MKKDFCEMMEEFLGHMSAAGDTAAEMDEQMAAHAAAEIDRQILNDLLYLQRIDPPTGTVFKLEIVRPEKNQLDPFDTARAVLGDFS